MAHFITLLNEATHPDATHIPAKPSVLKSWMMEWITAPPGMRKLILWMYGPAGSGKTAIAQSIAEECARLGLLAASFFFWRTAARRNDASRFMATLAYQLSQHIPQMQEHLFDAVERDPTIFSRSLSTQMRVLVIEPLKLAAPSLSTAMFAIVDGVDECGPDGRSQSELLHLLASLVSELQHLPLIFLIASRPEYEIREAFNENLLNPLTKVLVLDNNYKPDKDIKRYFNSTFRKICQEHRRIGRCLPSPWPAAGDVDSLVSKASGQFIFAATVTKYIDSHRHNPAERMDIILRLLASRNDAPFALLDALYRFVLDSVAEVEKVLDILTLILLDDEGVGNLNKAEELLGFGFRSALVDMHSLVCVSPPSDTNAKLPTVYHASLEDFLMDRSRSRQYYIGKNEGHLRLSRYCLKAMERFPHFEHLNPCNAIRNFGHHAKQSPANVDLANDLAQLDLRAVLEGISDIGTDLYGTNWQAFFDGVKTLAGSDRLDIFLRLQNDLDMFLLNRITQYPPSFRAHIPVLLCCLINPGSSGDLLRILLLGASNSVKEQAGFLNLDKRLLTVNETRSGVNKQTWESLFRDKCRAGEYFVDGKSYAALATAIVSVVYSEPGERNRRIRFARNGGQLYVQGVWDPTMRTRGWDPLLQMRINDEVFKLIAAVLENASTDWDLTNFLRERAIQYRDDMEPSLEWRIIAQASVKYIQRCGISFLEHTHQPDMNKCAICDLCHNAVVVEEEIPDILMEPPPRLPSIEDIDDFLAAVGMVDGVPAYPFTHKLDISVAPDGAIVTSFVGEPPFSYKYLT